MANMINKLTLTLHPVQVNRVHYEPDALFMIVLFLHSQLSFRGPQDLTSCVLDDIFATQY